MENYSYAGRNVYDGEYAAYLDNLKAVYQKCFSRQRAGGRCAIQIDAVSVPHGPSGYAVTLPLYYDIVRIMREVGYEFLDEICWHKQTTPGSANRARWGSHMSPRAPRMRRSHEYIPVFFKGVPYLDGDEKLNTIFEKEFRQLTISQWYVPPETRTFPTSDGMEHPCPFPETLAYRLIQLYTRKGDLIVDPMCGTSTVPYVAHCMNRLYCGIDLDSRFTEIAERRIAAVAGLTQAEKRAGLRLFWPSKFERADGHGPRNPDAKCRSTWSRRRHEPKGSKSKRKGKSHDAAGVPPNALEQSGRGS